MHFISDVVEVLVSFRRQGQYSNIGAGLYMDWISNRTAMVMLFALHHIGSSVAMDDKKVGNCIQHPLYCDVPYPEIFEKKAKLLDKMPLLWFLTN